MIESFDHIFMNYFIMKNRKKIIKMCLLGKKMNIIVTNILQKTYYKRLFINFFVSSSVSSLTDSNTRLSEYVHK
jgi:hypothetical protein